MTDSCYFPFSSQCLGWLAGLIKMDELGRVSEAVESSLPSSASLSCPLGMPFVSLRSAIFRGCCEVMNEQQLLPVGPQLATRHPPQILLILLTSHLGLTTSTPRF